MKLVLDIDEDQIAQIAKVKIAGARVLERLCKDVGPDFVVLFSSTAAVLGGIGLVAYAGANAVLDSIAESFKHQTTKTRWISIAWDAWLTPRFAHTGMIPPGLLDNAITPAEGTDTLFEILATSIRGSVIVSKSDLNRRSEAITRAPEIASPAPVAAASTEKHIVNESVAAVRSSLEIGLEEGVITAWKTCLGVSRIGRDQNFFDLGGNSLIALRIISELQRTMGVSVPVVTFFEAATVAGLVAMLEGNVSKDVKAPDAAKYLSDVLTKEYVT